VQFRWRFTSDVSVGGVGWLVDTIAVTDGFACCDSDVPPPVIQSITRLGDRITLSWLAFPGRTYRLQYKTALADELWNDVAGDVVASSGQASQSDVPGDAGQRFYRVVLLP